MQASLFVNQRYACQYSVPFYDATLQWYLWRELNLQVFVQVGNGVGQFGFGLSLLTLTSARVTEGRPDSSVFIFDLT